MKKCFVLSWFYPPINSSESFVTYKLLSNSCLKYDVWTREGGTNSVWDRAVEEGDYSSNNIKVIRSKEKQMKKWAESAADYFVKNIDEYDCIMTRSMPAEAHLIGETIKKRFPNVKWIASLGDPLTNTPYICKNDTNPFLLREYLIKEQPSKLNAIRIAISPTRNLKKMLWKKEMKADGFIELYKRINDVVIRNADAIIVNNNYQFEHLFSGKYEGYKGKGIIVTHSYDDSFYDKRSGGRNKKIVFSYTGHLDKNRNPSILLRAIKELLDRDKDLSSKVEFNFYGHMDDSDKLFILDNSLFDIVHLCGDVSYKESLKIMQSSDWLLLFDANFAKYTDKNIYFPAKLVDYIGSGSNIFGITQINGASADIMRDIGGCIVASHSVDEVKMYLAGIIYKKYNPGKPNEKERQKYNSKNVARQYDERIKEIINAY